jgi:tRNA threonylcarbamoyladenosine biosynthesis protein TsaE
MTLEPDIWLADSAATEALGADLARLLPTPAIVYLQGDLGAGKTTLVRGLLRALGHVGAVKSPTYTLIEPYDLAGRRILHCDLYRLADPEELEFLGLRDELDDNHWWLVEWPECGAGWLPAATLTVVLHRDAGGRRCELLFADQPSLEKTNAGIR